MFIILAFHLIEFTGPDRQKIELNPSEVVSIREVKKTEHFGHDIRCIIHTTDGKFISVIEDCATVHKRLEAAGDPP